MTRPGGGWTGFFRGLPRLPSSSAAITPLPGPNLELAVGSRQLAGSTGRWTLDKAAQRPGDLVDTRHVKFDQASRPRGGQQMLCLVQRPARVDEELPLFPRVPPARRFGDVRSDRVDGSNELL